VRQRQRRQRTILGAQDIVAERVALAAHEWCVTTQLQRLQQLTHQLIVRPSLLMMMMMLLWRLRQAPTPPRSFISSAASSSTSFLLLVLVLL